jgi:hypothetical protein
MYGIKKSPPCNKLQIHYDRTRHTACLITLSRLSVEPREYRQSSILPVPVAEDDAVGRIDQGRQPSRRRPVFGSDPTWWCKYPLDTGLLWTCSCQALEGTICPGRSKKVPFWACDYLRRLQTGKVEQTWVGSWFDLNQDLPQARLEPYDVHL